jgi:hypothetical protein
MGQLLLLLKAVVLYFRLTSSHCWPAVYGCERVFHSIGTCCSTPSTSCADLAAAWTRKSAAGANDDHGHDDPPPLGILLGII